MAPCGKKWCSEVFEHFETGEAVCTQPDISSPLLTLYLTKKTLMRWELPQEPRLSHSANYTHCLFHLTLDASPPPFHYLENCKTTSIIVFQHALTYHKNYNQCWCTVEFARKASSITASSLLSIYFSFDRLEFTNLQKRYNDTEPVQVKLLCGTPCLDIL